MSPGGFSTLHPSLDGILESRRGGRAVLSIPPYKPPGCWQCPSRGCHPDQIKELRFTGRIKRLLPPWKELGDRDQLCSWMLQGKGGGCCFSPAEGMCHSWPAPCRCLCQLCGAVPAPDPSAGAARASACPGWAIGGKSPQNNFF